MRAVANQRVMVVGSGEGLLRDARVARLGSTASGWEIETVGPDAACRVTAEARRQRSPFAVAVVDAAGLEESITASLAEALLKADPDLLLVLARSERFSLDAALPPGIDRSRVLLLRSPVDGEELRQAVLVQLARRIALGEYRAVKHELDSASKALENAQRQVASAEKAKSEFMANVSHEIRTPMNAILGFTELLLNEPFAPAQMEKLHNVFDAGQRLLAAINKLLDFSRLVSGELKLKLQTFQLAPLVAEAAAMLKPVAHATGVTLDWHVEASVPLWLRGDAARIRQVLFHLLENAVKFTPQGNVHVQAVLDEETDSRATVRVVVTDTGVGISEDRQEAVFDSFYQADGSSTRAAEGMGLGLTISKHLVELMGGHIGLRSVPDEGSTFWFVLPLVKGAESEPEVVSPAPAPEDRSSPPDSESASGGCLAPLRAALEEGNLKELERQAALIRGRALRCGITVLADHALRVQLASRSAELGRAARAFHWLEMALLQAPSNFSLTQTELVSVPGDH